MHIFIHSFDPLYLVDIGNTNFTIEENSARACKYQDTTVSTSHKFTFSANLFASLTRSFKSKTSFSSAGYTGNFLPEKKKYTCITFFSTCSLKCENKGKEYILLTV